ncbi:hypothetical protein IW147_000887 [Coemansia sp. RSA 720]|nr:hypothetical protein IW147_000887 [Coemansia sp. RSA 720]
MSIPTVFTNANCDTSIANETIGGAMPKFCQPFASDNPRSIGACFIKDRDAYNEYQLDCVNRRHGKFVDNNNNTVWVESTSEYTGLLKKPVKFPIGSHDNMHFVPVSRYEPPYPIFVSKENCDSRHDFAQCCPVRPTWSFEEMPDPEGKCALIDDEYRQKFGECCVNFIYGTYVDPIDGTTVTATGVDPKSEQPTDANTSHSTDSDSSSAKPSHTVTVTKCLAALLSINLFLMTTNLF